MGRDHFMTIGAVLMFVGIQFYMVKTYVLTPQSTQFLANRMTDLKEASSSSEQSSTSPDGFTSGFSQGAYNPQRNKDPFANSSNPSNSTNTFLASSKSGFLSGPQKELNPPPWFKWAAIFLGAVLFVHGAIQRV